MKKERYFFPFFISYCCFFIGCSSLDPSISQTKSVICAQFNDKQLTIKQAIEKTTTSAKPSDIPTIESYCKQWVKNQILLEHAKNLNLDKNTAFQNKLQDTHDFILLQHLKEAILYQSDNSITVSDDEAKIYFQENREQFILHEKYVRFRHFESPSLRNARTAKAQILKGESWENVAQKYSLAPDVRIEQAKQFSPISNALIDISILNQYLKIIGINEVSPIRKIRNNYHFVQLLEETPQGEHPDIKWLLRLIKDWLSAQKRKKQYEQYVSQIEKKAYDNHNITFFNVRSIQIDSLSSNAIQTDSSLSNNP